MSYLRITEPGVGIVDIDDLGIAIAQSATVVLSDQFSVNDLYISADLEALIIAGTLAVELDFGTGYTAVSAGDYTNRDALATFMNVYEITNENNNEDLVDGTDVNDKGPAAAPLHIHDARYYTETELSSTTASSGGLLIGIDDTNFTNLTGTTAQALFDDIDDLLNTLVTLDAAYTNDTDGILNVNGITKPLEFKSDGSATNDVIISREVGLDYQTFLRADISADELILGSVAAGGLGAITTRLKHNLIVEGNITYDGTITDTTVNELNVTNANILLRDGAVSGADASIEVERGATGPDACLLWNETTDKWQHGIVGSKSTMVGNELDENIEGVWCFGGTATEPNLCLKEKAVAPTTNLGLAGDIPMAMLPDGILCVYDKSNSRNKFLSVMREHMSFSGRDSQNNSNEYARLLEFTSNQAGSRLIRNATLVGMSIQTFGVETWTAEVRKNGAATVLASLASGGAAGAQATTYNLDANAGDQIQVFINGTQINRPIIKLEWAYRF